MKLEKLEKLCEEATPGPWEIEAIQHQQAFMRTSKGEFGIRYRIWIDQRQDFTDPTQNAKFIAAARTYMPKLIKVAQHLETIVHNFEELQTKEKNYFFDFSPNMKAARKALEELEKDEK